MEDKKYYSEYSRTPLIERIFHALRGIRNAWEKEPNFRIQVFAALLVSVAMLILPLTNTERSILVIVIAFVLALEIINSIFERVLDIIHPQFSKEIGKIKDTMAGVVFLASAAAVVVGAFVLTRPLLQFDAFLHGALDPFRATGWIKVSEVVTRLGDWQMVFYVTAFVSGYLIYKKRWELFTFLAGSVLGTYLILFVLKLGFGRERPVDTDLFGALGYSFPSGHVMGATVLYFAIAFILSIKMGYKNYIWVSAGLVVLLVALSRVALSVHWFSDIVAGLVLGVFWLMLWYGINKRSWELVKQ